jgi:hypothetical protein
MTPIPLNLVGRVYSVLLAPVTAHVVVQVNDRFFETFLPRTEAETLRVGRTVVSTPSARGTTLRLV